MPREEKYQFIDIPTGHKSQVGKQECLSLELPADMRYITAIDQLLRTLCQMTDPRAEQEKYLEDMSTALRECCSHLIERCHNPQLQFGISFLLYSNRIEIGIEEPLTKIASTPAQTSEDDGYALHLIQNRVDKVSYKTADGRGVLTLIKYFAMPPCEL